MGVPAHDERDFDFAKKYDLEIVPVVRPKEDDLEEPLTEAHTEEGILINSGKFNNLESAQASGEIIPPTVDNHS